MVSRDIGYKSGNGVLPIGSVIALSLDVDTGGDRIGYSVPFNQTFPDENGWISCDGQLVNDADSPFDGFNVPNINNQSFLMGGIGAGTGGSNTMPDHVHGILEDSDIYFTETAFDHYHLGYTDTDTHNHKMFYDSIQNGGTFDPNNSIATGGNSTPGTNGLSPNFSYRLAGTNFTPDTGKTSTNRHNHAFILQTPNWTNSNQGRLNAEIDFTSFTAGDGDLPQNTDNRPQFVTVQYVMRIK